MTSAQLPSRDVAELVRDQQKGIAAWHGDIARRLARDPQAEPDREAQMDARRRLAGLYRTRSAVLACEARRDRGLAPTAEAPRAVVVHRNAWLRGRLAQGLKDQGVQVVGEAEDGAVAVAMVVVEQPDLLLLEDRLPWVTPLEVVDEAHRYAPHTVVAVQLEDSAEASDMLAAGASAVYSRGVPPDQLSEHCVDLLVAEALERSA